MAAFPDPTQDFSTLPDWLDSAGLGAIELMVARAHRRSAERLVDALFLACTSTRNGLVALDRGITALLRRRRPA